MPRALPLRGHPHLAKVAHSPQQQGPGELGADEEHPAAVPTATHPRTATGCTDLSEAVL